MHRAAGRSRIRKSRPGWVADRAGRVSVVAAACVDRPGVTVPVDVFPTGPGQRDPAASGPSFSVWFGEAGRWRRVETTTSGVPSQNSCPVVFPPCRYGPCPAGRGLRSGPMFQNRQQPVLATGHRVASRVTRSGWQPAAGWQPVFPERWPVRWGRPCGSIAGCRVGTCPGSSWPVANGIRNNA